MIIRHDEEDSQEVINMSSLLDVMFILIIFFLATTTFEKEERDTQVSLPEESEGSSLSSSMELIVINVRKNNAYVVLNKQVTVEEMTAMVEQSVKETPDIKVLVRADQEAPHGYVAKAISICKRAGVPEAHIGYQLPK